MKNKKSFTLIELLVVIAIIGVLSTVVLISLKSIRAKARDARRLSDMKQIQTALEEYYSDYGHYPQENSSNGSWEISNEDGGDFIDDLKDKGYMDTVPVDPMNISGDYYCYYNYPASSAKYYNCPEENDFYVLGVKNMETSNRPYPQSPGWSCPGRNWQNEFDWVTGSFE